MVRGGDLLWAWHGVARKNDCDNDCDCDSSDNDCDSDNGSENSMTSVAIWTSRS